ncbi:hypothetical protein EJB05_03061, partial [Eragrostis curvula]
MAASLRLLHRRGGALPSLFLRRSYSKPPAAAAGRGLLLPRLTSSPSVQPLLMLRHYSNKVPDEGIADDLPKACRAYVILLVKLDDNSKEELEKSTKFLLDQVKRVEERGGMLEKPLRQVISGKESSADLVVELTRMSVEMKDLCKTVR